MTSERAPAGWTAEVVVDSTVPVELIRSARTTYPVIVEPPVEAGGDHVAVAVTLPPATPADAVPMTGAPGTVAAATGVTVPDCADHAPEPTAFTARTRKLYAVPLVSPVTTVLAAACEFTVTVRRTVVPVRAWTS